MVYWFFFFFANELKFGFEFDWMLYRFEWMILSLWIWINIIKFMKAIWWSNYGKNYWNLSCITSVSRIFLKENFKIFFYFTTFTWFSCIFLIFIFQFSHNFFFKFSTIFHGFHVNLRWFSYLNIYGKQWFLLQFCKCF